MMNEQIKWNGYEFCPPKGQEVFYSTDWFTAKLSNEKVAKSYECLWRLVDTSAKVTGNLETSSIESVSNKTFESEKCSRSNGVIWHSFGV